MKTVKLTLTKDNKVVEYFFDLEKSTYRSYSVSEDDGIKNEIVSEEGVLGNDANRQIIANRLHYILLASFKEAGLS